MHVSANNCALCAGLPRHERNMKMRVTPQSDKHIQNESKQTAKVKRLGWLKLLRGRNAQGSADIRDVELRFFGQNNIRAGITVSGMGSLSQNSVNITSVAMNRGYFGAVHLEQSNGVLVRNCTWYRAFLPALEVRTCINGRTCTYMSARCTLAFSHSNLRLHALSCNSLCLLSCIYVCMYACMYVCVYVCVCVYIYIYVCVVCSCACRRLFMHESQVHAIV
jgi:hypothetical protein